MPEAPGCSGIIARAVAALILVFSTYNPEQFSYYHWVIAPLRAGGTSSGPASIKFLVGLVLLAGWVIFLTATRRSIGLAGALVVLAISGGLAWVLLDLNIVSASSGRGLVHVLLFCTALLLAVGVNWSHISRRLSGQVDMDPGD